MSEHEAFATAQPVEGLKALLEQAIAEQWDEDRILREAVVLARAQTFDEVVRAIWLAAGQTFGTVSLYGGLVTAYQVAVRRGRE